MATDMGDAVATVTPAAWAPGPRVPAPRRRTPAPACDAAFAHLDLAALRSQRNVLQEEERRTSYWRRVVQARIDLFVIAGRGPRSADPRAGIERVRQALTDPQRRAGRQVALGITAVHGLPAAPGLSGLHDLLGPLEPGAGPAAVAAVGAEARSRHLLRLSELETQLSAYRRTLHAQLDAATAELIARYHADPTRCLVALPVGPSRG